MNAGASSRSFLFFVTVLSLKAVASDAPEKKEKRKVAEKYTRVYFARIEMLGLESLSSWPGRPSLFMSRNLEHGRL